MSLLLVIGVVSVASSPLMCSDNIKFGECSLLTTYCSFFFSLDLYTARSLCNLPIYDLFQILVFRAGVFVPI